MFAAKDQKQQEKAVASDSKNLDGQTNSALQVNESVDSLRTLQRNLGNSYLQAIAPIATNSNGLNSQWIQPKLKIGSPNDKYEQEADLVADQIMRMPEPTIQRQMGLEEDEEEGIIQREIANSITPLQRDSTDSQPISEAPPSVHEVLQSPGQPLDSETRAFMEPRFRHDFSRVRVHSGVDAEQSARDMNANAYTVGQNIVFGEGQFAPKNATSQRLIAHELTHVVQQSSSHISRPLKRVPEANWGGSATSQNTPVNVETHAPIHVARDSKAGTSQMKVMRILDLEIHPEAREVVIKTNVVSLVMPLAYTNIVPGVYSVTAKLNETTDKSDATDKLKRRIILRLDASPQERARMRGGAQVANQLSSLLIDSSIAVDPTPRNVQLFVGGLDEDLAPDESKSSDKDVSESTRTTNKKPPDDTPIIEAGNENTVMEEGQSIEPSDHQARGEQQGITGSNNPPDDSATETPSQILPAYPSNIEGADVQVKGGNSVYKMKLDYRSTTNSFAGMVFEAANKVDYIWEVYQIGKDKRTVGKTDAALDELSKVDKNLDKESQGAAADLKENIKQGEIVEALANAISIKLEGVSAILKYTSGLLTVISDATSNIDFDRPINWPNEEGSYILRVVAQPAPRMQSNGKLLRREPSIALKSVTVQAVEKVAEDALFSSNTKLEELKLAFALETDEKRKAKLAQQISNLEVLSFGSALDAINLSLSQLEEQLKLAEKQHDWIKANHLRIQIDDLKLQRDLAAKRSATMGNQNYRPQATITSEITGQSYPLWLQLFLKVPESEGGNYTATVSDVTSKSGKGGQGEYAGSASTASDAAWLAMERLAGNNDYGPGTLAIRLPEGGPFDTTLKVFTNRNRGTALARQRLNDLATVLGTVAIVVPGLGEAAMVVGATVAADRLINRYRNGTLELDAESINDMLAMIGAAAAGANMVPKLSAIREGQGLASEGVRAGGRLLDGLQLFMGMQPLLEEFAKLNRQEAEGLSPVEARRQRVQLLNSAIQNYAGEFSRLAGTVAESRKPQEGHPSNLPKSTNENQTTPKQPQESRSATGVVESPTSKPTPVNPEPSSHPNVNEPSTVKSEGKSSSVTDVPSVEASVPPQQITPTAPATDGVKTAKSEAIETASPGEVPSSAAQRPATKASPRVEVRERQGRLIYKDENGVIRILPESRPANDVDSPSSPEPVTKALPVPAEQVYAGTGTDDVAILPRRDEQPRTDRTLPTRAMSGSEKGKPSVETTSPATVETTPSSPNKRRIVRFVAKEVPTEKSGAVRSAGETPSTATASAVGTSAKSPEPSDKTAPEATVPKVTREQIQEQKNKLDELIKERDELKKDLAKSLQEQDILGTHYNNRGIQLWDSLPPEGDPKVTDTKPVAKARIRYAELQEKIDRLTKEVDDKNQGIATQFSLWQEMRVKLPDELTWAEQKAAAIKAFPPDQSNAFEPFEKALKSSSLSEEGSILRRWSKSIELLCKDLDERAQQILIEKLLHGLTSNFPKSKYDDFRRLLRKEIVDYVVSPNLNDQDRFSRILEFMKVQPDPASRGHLFGAYREADLSRLSRREEGYNITPIDPGARGMSIEGAQEVVRIARDVDGLVKVTDTIKVKSVGAIETGIYGAEDKAGKKSFDQEQAQHYSELLNHNKGTLKIKGQEAKGVIYFFSDKEAAMGARDFMNINSLNSEIHIAYYTSEGPVFIR